MRSGNIEHEAIVRQINGDIAQVEILVQSACVGCHARSMCNASDESRRIVEVKTDLSFPISVGETITVIGREIWGITAVTLAYVVPVFLLLTILIICKEFSFDDAKAGLLALSSLVPYFVILYFFRKRFSKTFAFKYQKHNNQKN
ncbi:MAG: SoxR reducing system RseC family protein [Marinilabiliaceae bacterium]|nr:SoxR reducing system RseC family protein [Marinilabiliaceae bacterium]